MRNLRRLSTLVSLVALAGALALALSPADASTPVEIRVSAVNSDGSQGCTECKLKLEVSGTVIDAPSGNGNLTGTAEFKAAGVETSLNIDKSEIVGTFDTFYMIQLTDTSKSGAGVPAKVQVRLMPSEGGPANIRVRDSLGGLVVQFDSGEYTVKIKLE